MENVNVIQPKFKEKQQEKNIWIFRETKTKYSWITKKTELH